jgi:hypothetical protein
VVEATAGSNSNWVVFTYTIPTTGVYILDWELTTTSDWKSTKTEAGYANGFFIDEFTIT